MKFKGIKPVGITFWNTIDKLWQTWEGIVGLKDTQGQQINPAKEEGREITPIQGTATSLGDTTIFTPIIGKKIRIYFFEANNGSSADITVYFQFGNGGTGKEFGKTLLAKNGGGFSRSLVNNYFEGAVDEVLKINLSATGTVNWSLGKTEV